MLLYSKRMYVILAFFMNCKVLPLCIPTSNDCIFVRLLGHVGNNKYIHSRWISDYSSRPQPSTGFWILWVVAC